MGIRHRALKCAPYWLLGAFRRLMAAVKRFRGNVFCGKVLRGLWENCGNRDSRETRDYAKRRYVSNGALSARS